MRRNRTTPLEIVKDPQRIALGDTIRVHYSVNDTRCSVEGRVYAREWRGHDAILLTQYGEELLHYGPGTKLPAAIIMVERNDPTTLSLIPLADFLANV